MEIEKWKDGTLMFCGECGRPIYTNQPRYATISHDIKNRQASHYFCKGGTMTIIGSPEAGVTEITQLGGKA